MSELRPMKFDEYYTIKLGLPANELPTFAFQIMNEFGAFGAEMYGSIHANFPVGAYSPDRIDNLLSAHIAEELELNVETQFVSVWSILGKPIEIHNILDYVDSTIDTVNIDIGVQLSCGPKPGILTVSRRHRPAQGDEVYAFATDIQKLRELHAVDYELANTAATDVGAWSGEMTTLRDLVAKYKHRFTLPKPKVEPYSVQGLYERILGWQNFDVHIRNVAWAGPTAVEITLGNCWIILNQRTKTLKVTVHTNGSGTQSGEARYYSAQSRKTIDAALADVLAVEKLGYQRGLGHYDRSSNGIVQYDAVKLQKWFVKLSKKLGLIVVKSDGDGKKGCEESYAAVSEDGGGVAVMRLDICFLHSEIEISNGREEGFNRVHFYHSTCEKQGKQNVEMYANIFIKHLRAPRCVE